MQNAGGNKKKCTKPSKKKNILSVKRCPCFAEKEPCLEIYTVRLYITA